MAMLHSPAMVPSGQGKGCPSLGKAVETNTPAKSLQTKGESELTKMLPWQDYGGTGLFDGLGSPSAMPDGNPGETNKLKFSIGEGIETLSPGGSRTSIFEPAAVVIVTTCSLVPVFVCTNGLPRSNVLKMGFI